MKHRKILFGFIKLCKKPLIRKFILLVLIFFASFYSISIILSNLISLNILLFKTNDNYDPNEIVSFDDDTNTADKLEEYFKLSERISKQKTLKKTSFNYYSGGGYGNRLCSFISSLLIGILTDSQTVVVNWSDIKDYIDLPTSSLFIQSENFLTMIFNYFSFIFRTCYVFGKQAWNPVKDINMLMKTHIPTNGFWRYVFNRADCLFMEICTNKKYFKKLFYYNLVTNNTIQTALSSISQNKSDDEKRQKLFRVGFEVGGNILNKIWKPNEDIQKEIDFYLKKEFQSNYMIGIQLRYGRKEDAIFLNGSADTIKFIECALQIEKDYYHTWENTSRKTVKWFIASDSEKNLNTILAKYPNKAFSSKGKVAHIAYYSEGYRRTIMDIELLSKCDELIITGGSTYGFIASMKMLKLPYFINGYSSMESCSRTLLSKPPVRPNGDKFSAFF